jgi:hypothetical protein
LRLAEATTHRRGLDGTLASCRETVKVALIHLDTSGEALDPDKLERLGRYEVHLDRKLERMLAMLLRPKDLRRPAEPD